MCVAQMCGELGGGAVGGAVGGCVKLVELCRTSCVGAVPWHCGGSCARGSCVGGTVHGGSYGGLLPSLYEGTVCRQMWGGAMGGCCPALWGSCLQGDVGGSYGGLLPNCM